MSPVNEAELLQNIEESIAIANKHLPGMDPDVARCIAAALNLHLHRSLVAFFQPRHDAIVEDAREFYVAHQDEPRFRVAAMWLAMEELAGASMESFIGAGDHFEKALAKNEATLRDLLGGTTE